MHSNSRDSSNDLLAAFKLHKGFLAIILLSAFLFLINLNAYQKFERAESYFSLGSKMLVETGELLLPHSLQELPLNKPPFQYWLIGAAYELFGVSYGSGRIPAALCALGILALTYFFGLRFFEKTVVLTATAMTGATWMFISFARMAMPDLVLTLFTGIAICSWTLVLTGKTNRPRALALIGYAAAAIGFLIKGPIALVLAFVPVALEILIARDFTGFKKLLPVYGAIVFFLIAAPYFLLVYVYHGTEPLHTFFIVENWGRFTGTGEYRSRTSSLQYPLTAFLGGFAPWSLLTMLVAYLDFRYGSKSENSRTLRMLYLWMIFPLVFFCISRFKLDYYLLPIIPALTLLTARIVSAEYLSFIRTRKVLIAFSIVISIILAAGLGAGLTFMTQFFPAIQLPYLPIVLAIIALIPIVLCIRSGKTQYILLSLAFQIWLIFSYLCLVFIPAFAQFQPSWTFAEKIPADAHVYLYEDAGGWVPNLAFQLPTSQFIKEFKNTPSAPELTDLLQNDPKAMLLIYEGDFWKIGGPDLRWQILGQEDIYPESSLSLKFISNPVQKRLLLITEQR